MHRPDTSRADHSYPPRPTISDYNPSMQPPSRNPTPHERLAGAVERVTFHSEQSGFCVLQVRARGQRGLMTVIFGAA